VVRRFVPILAMTSLCWVLLIFDQVLWHGQLAQYGIVPRHLSSLPGILWSPFLHGSFRHLVANTLPLLVLGAVLCARGRSEFIVVTVGGILLSGSLTWLVGRNGSHVGASGLIFCYFGYLASLACFDRKLGTLLLSLACIVVYGGMVRGLVPTGGPVSWEGHVAGVAAGIVLAGLMANVKRTPVAKPGE
jgi:membrane associated rhomboid family serine protease